MSDTTDDRLRAIAEFLAVIDRLRDPQRGCPWDLAQSESSMAPHLLEEAYEAVDALRSGEPATSCEELGDVLMNVAMIARIASESDRYDLGEVARVVARKLVRRHPHVFAADTPTNDDAATVLANWERIKLSERGAPQDGAIAGDRSRILAGLPTDLPGLLRAFRVGEKVARVGFDWPDAAGPRAKVDEELGELDAALASGEQSAIEGEFGDLLFAVANLARHCGVNPEMALRGTIERFDRRFAHVERQLGDRLPDAGLAELERHWVAAKRLEAEASGGDRRLTDGKPSAER